MPYSYLTFDNQSLTNGIVSGSYFTTDLQSIYEQKIVNKEKYFGTSENDIIEFSLYNTNQEIISFNRVIPTVSYSIIRGTYNDINNSQMSYNFAKPFTNFTKYNNSLLLDTKSNLNTIGVLPGLYYILYNFVRNVAGNPKNKLIIKEISPSRTELRLSLGFNPTLSPENNNDAIKISAFADKKYLFSQISNQLNQVLDNNPISNNFLQNSINFNYLEACQYLGLKNTAELEKFISETYVGFNKIKNLSSESDQLISQVFKFTGINEQIKNFTYTYNLVEFSKNEILLAVETIVTKVSQDRILQKTSINQIQLDSILNVFKKIIYTDWLEPQINLLLDDYFNRYFGLYKNALNFDNGELIKILNHTSYINPNDGRVNVQIKLDQPLSQKYDIRSSCWISNISISPLYFKTNLFTEPVSRKVYLNGVNFTVDVDTTKSSNKDYESYKPETLFSVKSDLKKKINDLLINYEQFDNFITYSSAELRTKICKNKIVEYNKEENKKILIDSKISGTTPKTISASFAIEKNNVVKNQIQLLKSFDEYESYLFFYGSSSIDQKISDGIDYDKNNLDSLINQLPTYIKESNDYDDYLKFTAMVGHFFDNILIYIKKFPKTYPLGKSELNDYPKNLLDELLNSFNWNTTNFNFQSSEIKQYLFDNTEYSESLSSSYFDYGKKILNRIANNLPIIYKTKGTATSLDLLRTLFGIPSELINIREYGSSDLLVNKQNYFDYEDIVYLTNFDGDQFINFNITSSDYSYVKNYWYDVKKQLGSSVLPPRYYQLTSSRAISEEFTGFKTFELGFRFKIKDYDVNNKIPIVKKIRNNKIDWQIYIKKTKQNESGILIFDLHPYESEYTSSIRTEELPFLNGSFYTMMVTRDELEEFDFDSRPVSRNDSLTSSYTDGTDFYRSITSSYTSSIQTKYIPQNFKLAVNQYEGSLKNFYSSNVKAINFNQHQYFSSGSFYVGNFSSSINFKGNIDKIKVFKSYISDEDFDEHSYNIDSISTTDTDTDKIYSNLLYYWSFDTPIDLWSHTSSVNSITVPNQNIYYQVSGSPNINSFKVHNFTGKYVDLPPPNCDNEKEMITKFPYQFDRLVMFQSINSNRFGPNYQNNVKINKIDQYASTNLVPYDYSTKTDDIFGGDSNVVGFYITPYTYLNRKIENFLGYEGITDIIGDPKYLTSQSYPELDDLRNSFAETNEKYIYPQEFFTTYKFYIDFSIFKLAKSLMPNRASYKGGLLLEASPLERQKFNYKDIKFSVDGITTASFSLDNTAKFSTSINTGSLTSLAVKHFVTKDKNDYNFSKFEIPDKVDDRDFIYSKFGKYINFNKNRFINKTNYDVLTYNYYQTIDTLGKLRIFTSSFNRVESIGSGSITSSSYFDTIYYGDNKSGYSQRHLSKISRPGSRQSYMAVSSSYFDIINGIKKFVGNKTKYYTYIKGKNDSKTTVNRQGLLNQSSPVISIPGFLNLRLSSSNFTQNGTLTGSIQSPNSIFKPVPITASLENSSSLNELIMNL